MKSLHDEIGKGKRRPCGRLFLSFWYFKNFSQNGLKKPWRFYYYYFHTVSPFLLEIVLV